MIVTRHIAKQKSWTDHSPNGTMYDVCTNYVIPWTLGLGCGVALLMNPEALAAGVMLSHCWAERVAELIEALGNWQTQHGVDDETTCIWFCVYANYQARQQADVRKIPDDGPSIPDQLKLDPFGTIIAHIKTMVTVHTSTADLYSRLWCVYEVDAAQSASHVTLIAALSNNYATEMIRMYELANSCGMTADQALTAAGLNVDTICAKAGNEHDIEMIWRKILSAGGFQRLNEAILWFRASVISQEAADHKELMLGLAAGVLDRFKFPAETVDPNGYMGFGVTMNRATIALKVLGEPTVDAGRTLFKTLGDKQAAINSRIFDTSLNKDPAGLQKALDDGGDVFSIIKGGNPKTALQVAAKWGNKECCEKLVKAGLDPHESRYMTSDGSGRQLEVMTSVHYAWENKHHELSNWLDHEGCIRFLQTKLDRQIDLSKQDQIWLDAAASIKGAGRIEALKLAYAVWDILGFPKEIDSPDGYHKCGVTSDCRSIAVKLLSEEPTLAKGRERFDHMAKELVHLNGLVFDMAADGNAEGLQKALDAGGDAFGLAKYTYGKAVQKRGGNCEKSALQIAAKWGHKKCCEILLKAGIDPRDCCWFFCDGSNRNMDPTTPSQYAAKKDHHELAAWLHSLPSVAYPYQKAPDSSASYLHFP